jgi:hypothetical protein
MCKDAAGYLLTVVASSMVPSSGLTVVPDVAGGFNTTVRYRDGSMSNNLVTDENGTANFNEEFPLFNWYVVEADTTRYKTTGIHTVYDSGGPADGSASCGQPGYPACRNSTIGKFLASGSTLRDPALLFKKKTCM